MQPKSRKSKTVKSFPGSVRSKNGNWFGKLFRQKQFVPVTSCTSRKRQLRAIIDTGKVNVGFSVNLITTELSTNTDSLLLACRASRFA